MSRTVDCYNSFMRKGHNTNTLKACKTNPSQRVSHHCMDPTTCSSPGIVSKFLTGDHRVQTNNTCVLSPGSVSVTQTSLTTILQDILCWTAHRLWKPNIVLYSSPYFTTHPKCGKPLGITPLIQLMQIQILSQSTQNPYRSPQ